MTDPSLARVFLTAFAGDPEALDELRGLLGPAEEPGDRLLTTVQAAEVLNINPQTCQRWAKSGRLRGAYWDGSRWRYRSSELEILPANASPSTIGIAARGTRRNGTSAATSAIRGDKAA